MALFIPAALFDDSAMRCPRRRCSAWDAEDELTPYDELLDSIVSPLLRAPARLLYSPQVQGRQPTRRPRQRPKWAECVELPGFSSEEVTTEVKDGRVVILGRHVQGEGDNQDVYEVKRTVPLPQDVDAEKVVCRHVPGRFVVVEGPRVQTESQPGSQDVPIQQQQADAPAERSDAAPHQEPVGEAPPAATTTTEPTPAVTEPTPTTPEAGAASSAADVPEAQGTSPAAAECPDSNSEETSVMRVVGDATETSRPSDTAADSAAPPEDNVTSAPPAENERDAENVDAPAKQTASVKPVMTQPAPAEVSSSSSPLKMQQEGGKPLSLPSQFEVGLDLRGFAPENVKVSVNGNSLVVEATRAEEGEYYSGTEQFRREVTLPKNVDSNSVRCFLGEDGRLKVTAPYTAVSDTVTVPIIAA